MKKLKLVLTGLLTGGANGLFGSGGGTILVPFLERFSNVAAHQAHGTAIGCILPLSALSAAIYYYRGSRTDWLTLGVLTLFGLAGSIIGAKILNDFKINKID